MYSRHIILSLIVRLTIALSTATFFQPDEYFQCLEVAHSSEFGYGYLTWEWTTERPVRSPLYPAIYAAVYRIVRLLRLDDTKILILAPKLLNGLIGGLLDISLLQTTERTLGPSYVDNVTLVSLTSLFNALSLTRSLSNSLEAALTTLAFSFCPWSSVHDASSLKGDLTRCVIFVALACVVRPTNAIIWFVPFGSLLYRYRSKPATFRYFILNLLLTGFAAITLLVVVDSWYFGRRTFTPLNFVLANMSISSYYGINQWHYYLTQGLPVLCTTALPFVIHGAWIMFDEPSSSVRLTYRTLLGTIALPIVVYSLGQHKEWRFIHPILPLLHICAAKSLLTLAYQSHARRWTQLPIRNTHLMLLLLNVPLIFYVMLFHGRAQISVMHHLRSIPPTRLDSVGFLMPCHSTPWQAYLHRSNLASTGKMWALTCEPPLHQNVSSYIDQTDVFYKDPAAYLRKHFPGHVAPNFPPSHCPMTSTTECEWKHEWPRFLVMFGALLDKPEVRTIVGDNGYAQTWHGINGFEEDERRRGGVVVLEWQGATP